jgi:D-tyrosyl-tRNA(Tyr) deacylase
VDEEHVAEIGDGLIVLLGVGEGDGENEARWVAGKCANLRIFKDEHGKMNRSVLEAEGEAIVVSQFTLYGDVRKGRRPSFVHAAQPEQAEPLVKLFADEMKQLGVSTQMGMFGAEMLVEIDNDGPVTIIIERDPKKSE